MKLNRRNIRDFGSTLGQVTAVWIGGILGTIIMGVVAISESFRRDVLNMNAFGLSVVPFTMIGIVVLTFAIVIFAVLCEVAFKRIGEKIIWLAEHRLGDAIAKTKFDIVEISTIKKSAIRDFSVKIKNKERIDAYDVGVCVSVMALKENEEPKYLGRTGIHWEMQWPNGDLTVKKLYKTVIPSGKEVENLFLRVDRENLFFYIKTSYEKSKFGVGSYSCVIDFDGYMEGKQFKGKKSGKVRFMENGNIDFDLQNIKIKRGWISLAGNKSIWDAN